MCLQRSPNAMDVYWVDSSGRCNTSISRRGCDGSHEAEALGSSTPTEDAVARSTDGTARAEAGVLERDRSRHADGGGGSERGYGSRCGDEVVPRVWWHGTVQAPPPVGSLSVLRRAKEIAVLFASGHGVREIARQLKRAPSTISREIRRNAATRSGDFEYRATTAQWHADRRAKRPRVAKLAANDRLRQYVQERLGGMIAASDGTSVPGPKVQWTGRRRVHRQPRRWANSWSPEQIANRLPVDFPDDDSMRISHEAIYQALYVQGRGALKRELTACLRTGQALRKPRARSGRSSSSFVHPEIMISERPAEADDRAVPGHWEGDLILGLRSSAIGTLVERSTRFTMLLHLPRLEGFGTPRTKNGPALAGHGAEAVRDAIATSMGTLPDQLRRSLIWDQGSGTRSTRATPHRHGPGDLLLRPTEPLAARQQREHERPVEAVLPQGYRSQQALSRCSRGGRRGTQRSAAQNPRLEDAGRSPQRLARHHPLSCWHDKHIISNGPGLTTCGRFALPSTVRLLPVLQGREYLQTDQSVATTP